MSKGGGASPAAPVLTNEGDRLAVRRGYLQQILVRLWNSCDRRGCEADYRDHRRGGYRVCAEFVPHEPRSYLTAIARWEAGEATRARERHSKAPEAAATRHAGVIIPERQREPLSRDDRRLAKVWGIE